MITVTRKPSRYGETAGNRTHLLTPTDRDVIAVLVSLGLWPKAQIAREFGVDRASIRRCVSTRIVTDQSVIPRQRDSDV